MGAGVSGVVGVVKVVGVVGVVRVVRLLGVVGIAVEVGEGKVGKGMRRDRNRRGLEWENG